MATSTGGEAALARETRETSTRPWRAAASTLEAARVLAATVPGTNHASHANPETLAILMRKANMAGLYRAEISPFATSPQRLALSHRRFVRGPRASGLLGAD